jgi:hypothetical protein
VIRPDFEVRQRKACTGYGAQASGGVGGVLEMAVPAFNLLPSLMIYTCSK